MNPRYAASDEIKSAFLTQRSQISSLSDFIHHGWTYSATGGFSPKKIILAVDYMGLNSHGFLMKCFSYEKHEIILANYEISRFVRYEIKLAF